MNRSAPALPSALPAAPHRSREWHALLLGLLLAATLLNYANRLTLSQTAVQVKRDFALNNEAYGSIEAVFGYAFAAGSLAIGFLSDLISVRWLYAGVVVLWSLAGASTSLVRSGDELWWSRLALGFFEGGHWSCALRTTQRCFPPHTRTRSNSLLQSGASVGAVLTPLLVSAVVTAEPGGWRNVFWIVGLFGAPWAVVWLVSVTTADLNRPVLQADDAAGGAQARLAAPTPLSAILLGHRFWVLLGVVLAINLSWHYIRVWMPATLQEDHGFTPDQTNVFTSVYYLATFIGCVFTGWWTAQLAVRGWTVHRARRVVFAACSVAFTFAVLAAFAPNRVVLLGSLLIAGGGGLGMFPVYYSLVQEISAQHQGKVGSLLGAAAWISLGPVHYVVGFVVDQSPASRPWFLAAAGLVPLLASFLLWFGWGEPCTRKSSRL